MSSHESTNGYESDLSVTEQIGSSLSLGERKYHAASAPSSPRPPASVPAAPASASAPPSPRRFARVPAAPAQASPTVELMSCIATIVKLRALAPAQWGRLRDETYVTPLKPSTVGLNEVQRRVESKAADIDSDFKMLVHYATRLRAKIPELQKRNSNLNRYRQVFTEFESELAEDQEERKQERIQWERARKRKSERAEARLQKRRRLDGDYLADLPVPAAAAAAPPAAAPPHIPGIDLEGA